MTRQLWYLVIAVFLEPVPLAAQVDVNAVGGGVGLRSAVPGLSEQVVGSAFGFEGGVRLGKAFLDLRYLDGSLSPGVEELSNRDVVDGRAGVGIRPLAWLALEVGPHLRAYGAASGAERWVLWEVRSRADVTLISGVATGHLDLSRALTASVNVPQPFGHAQGGAVGLTLRPAGGSYELGLDYEVDDAEFDGLTRHETFEAVMVHLGLALP